MIKLRLLFLLGCGLMIFVAPVTPTHAAPPVIGGCQIFPDNNAWNTDISNAPVHALSKKYIKNINRNGGKFVHPDFGDNQDYGIPWIDVDGSTQPFVPVTFDYDDESDPGPYPIPHDAPVEGGGDRHVLVVDTNDCTLYEMYASEFVGGPNNAWHAGSGAVYDLNSNDLRPDGWTSADAAGLPILPGLARCDEVMAGEITHALRFTVNRTQSSWVYPATHEASNITDPTYPPMGLRFRLKANYDISGFSQQAKVIATALKKYGMILADNGSNWYISGERDRDECWDDNQLNDLKGIPGKAFEVIVSPPAPSAVEGDRVANGGFEGRAVTGLPTNWSVINRSKEKRICNNVNPLNPGSNVIHAFEGQCAFMFRGRKNEASTLNQRLDITGLQVNDEITLNAQIKGEGVPDGTATIVIKAKFTDKTKDKVVTPIPGGTYDYQLVTAAASFDKEIKRLIVNINYTGTTGRFYVDALSVTSASAPLLPLPAAP